MSSVLFNIEVQSEYAKYLQGEIEVAQMILSVT